MPLAHWVSPDLAPQVTLALPRVHERRHAFPQFGKQIALVRTRPPGSHLCHVAFVAIPRVTRAPCLWRPLPKA